MPFLGSLAVLCCILICGNGQSISGGTVLEVMTSSSQVIGLRTFGSWLNEISPGFYSGSTKMTVFAFNDTFMNLMPSAERTKLMSMDAAQKKEYIETYTVPRTVQQGDLTDGSIQYGMNGKQLFINRRDFSNAQSGGVTLTFVNGAQIVGTPISASNGVIYILDRPLGLISYKNAYSYMNAPDDNTIQIEEMRKLSRLLLQNYYTVSIAPLAYDNRITLFLPSDKAIATIPISKRSALQGEKLSKVFRQHFIPNRAVFTSAVKHQDNYQSGLDGNFRVVFLRNGDTVYVKSGGVTAKIERGNITVENGVIHIVDRLLGFVYNSAREQLSRDAIEFNRLLEMVDPQIKSMITQPRNLNLFVPSDAAFQYVTSLPWINLNANRTLLNFIFKLHILKSGSIDVAQLNGNYDVRQRRLTQYNDWSLTIYNDRNDTWVQGGYVRARITRPDVEVTTGQFQYIDAVLGVPTMDIPTLIYYDEWLMYTYNDLKMLGLDLFLKDPRYDPAILPPRSFNGNGDPSNPTGIGNNFVFTTQNPYGNQYPNNQNNQYPTPYPGYPSNNYDPNSGYPNNQYPNNNNNQYPNNQYPNNGYPNSQYPNSGYPQSSNQVSPFGTCGSFVQPCEFTFFCPNGSAIYNFYLKNMGNRIIQDHPRYRYIMRRLLIQGPPKYIEHLRPSSKSYIYRTHSGETVTLKKETDNIARLYWGGESARVIMWDLGATNGVIHVIDTVLSDISDINRDISRASGLLSQNFMFMLSVAAMLSVWLIRR